MQTMSQGAILYDIVIRCAWPDKFFTGSVLLPIPRFLQNFPGVIQDICVFALFYFSIFICQGIQLAFVTGGCNMLQSCIFGHNGRVLHVLCILACKGHHFKNTLDNDVSQKLAQLAPSSQAFNQAFLGTISAHYCESAIQVLRH